MQLDQKQYEQNRWKMYYEWITRDSKIQGANMGPSWGRQDPGGPHELCYLGLKALVLTRMYVGIFVSVSTVEMNWTETRSFHF